MAETLFPKFMEMMDRCGITPTGTDMERFSKERDVMTMLERVRDFPPERLPEIEAWIKDSGKVRRPDTVILEMQARMAQSGGASSWVQKRDGQVTDEHIIQWAGKKLEGGIYHEDDCALRPCFQWHETQLHNLIAGDPIPESPWRDIPKKVADASTEKGDQETEVAKD